MNSDNVKMQAAIGLFILSAIIITMLMVVYMTGGVRLDGDAYLVVINIDNIGDLKSGAPVKFGGVEIGKVKQITVEDNGVQIVAGINARYKLQADTTARIATSGLVGDAFLEFTRGKTKEQLPCSQNIADAARIPGESQSDMGDMLAQVQKIGAQVEDLVANINQLIGKKEFRENIEQSVANVNSVTAEIKSLLVDFHDNLDQVDKAVENIVKITGDAQTTMNTVDEFVTKIAGDPALADNLTEAVKNMSSITKVLNENKESIGSTLQNIGRATGNMADLTGNIKPDRGIMRLLNDEQAGQDIMSVISSLQRAARCLATVGLSDLIADKLIADKIAEKWLSANGRRSADEMAYQWKTWMSQQKAYTDSLSRQSGYVGGYVSTPAPGTVRRYPAATVLEVPAGNDVAAYESFYDTPMAGETNVPVSRVQVVPTPPATKTMHHPLESLYNR